MRFASPSAIALAILVIAIGSIAAALIIEALGYAPCELCLKERIPYYAAIPLAGLAVFFAARGSKTFLRTAFFALFLIFAGSAVLGAYHAGFEWGFWPGPTDCSGTLDHPRSIADFLSQLQSVKIVRCDVPSLRIAGLSLAAWNVVISAGLDALAAIGLLYRRKGGLG